MSMRETKKMERWRVRMDHKTALLISSLIGV